MTHIIYATVKIRRGEQWEVKPGAELLEGYRHRFTRGWTITEDDSGIYAGETAWLADKEDWPSTDILWLAEGDLTDISKTR